MVYGRFAVALPSVVLVPFGRRQARVFVVVVVFAVVVAPLQVEHKHTVKFAKRRLKRQLKRFPLVTRTFTMARLLLRLLVKVVYLPHVKKPLQRAQLFRQFRVVVAAVRVFRHVVALVEPVKPVKVKKPKHLRAAARLLVPLLLGRVRTLQQPFLPPLLALAVRTLRTYCRNEPPKNEPIRSVALLLILPSLLYPTPMIRTPVKNSRGFKLPIYISFPKFQTPSDFSVSVGLFVYFPFWYSEYLTFL